jgi:hypothetical protein
MSVSFASVNSIKHELKIFFKNSICPKHVQTSPLLFPKQNSVRCLDNIYIVLGIVNTIEMI